MVLKDVLVNGKWVHPELKICPVCRHVIHALETECMVCKDLEAARKRRTEREENKRDKCPACGAVLVNGHCPECNVQVILA